MTVRIELSAEVQESLAAQAQAQGLPLPQFVENLLREQAVRARQGAALSPAERVRIWMEGTHGLPHTPPLSDEAISRASMYQDRD